MHFGEGDYEQTEEAIRSLLAEAGDKQIGAEARPEGEVETADAALRTPETYLGGAARAGAGSTARRPGRRTTAPSTRPHWN